jgi:pSer/pThr/pTyr-binding forkhead associated (FHA) protein
MDVGRPGRPALDRRESGRTLARRHCRLRRNGDGQLLAIVDDRELQCISGLERLDRHDVDEDAQESEPRLSGLEGRRDDGVDGLPGLESRQNGRGVDGQKIRTGSSGRVRLKRIDGHEQAPDALPRSR